MRQARHELRVRTGGAGFYEITREVERWVAGQGIADGLVTVFLHHTSASLLIQENADPDVQVDLMTFFHRLAPESAGYRHSTEGPDDMPAHMKAALTAVQLAVPVVAARLDLGTWQGIYVVEHRKRPHERRVTLHLVGE